MDASSEGSAHPAPSSSTDGGVKLPIRAILDQISSVVHRDSHAPVFPPNDMIPRSMYSASTNDGENRWSARRVFAWPSACQPMLMRSRHH